MKKLKELSLDAFYATSFYVRYRVVEFFFQPLAFVHSRAAFEITLLRFPHVLRHA